MECACIYVDSEDSQPEIFKSRRQTANKQHACCECNRIIPPGESYEIAVGKWDGKFETFKTCSDCLSVRREFFCEGFFFEMMFDNLHEHLNEIQGQVSSDCLLDLTPAAMTKVCGMIDKIWED